MADNLKLRATVGQEIVIDRPCRIRIVDVTFDGLRGPRVKFELVNPVDSPPPAGVVCEEHQEG